DATVVILRTPVVERHNGQVLRQARGTGGTALGVNGVGNAVWRPSILRCQGSNRQLHWLGSRMLQDQQWLGFFTNMGAGDDKCPGLPSDDVVARLTQAAVESQQREVELANGAAKNLIVCSQLVDRSVGALSLRGVLAIEPDPHPGGFVRHPPETRPSV